jgi:hypothetical protein
LVEAVGLVPSFWVAVPAPVPALVLVLLAIGAPL